MADLTAYQQELEYRQCGPIDPPETSLRVGMWVFILSVCLIGYLSLPFLGLPPFGNRANYPLSPVYYIPAGKFGIATIDGSEQETILSPGVHFLNPLKVDAKVYDPLVINQNEFGLTKDGKLLTPGKYHIRKSDVTISGVTVVPPGYVGVVKATEKGIIQEGLKPGIYYLDPNDYELQELEKAKEYTIILEDGKTAIVKDGKITSIE